MKRNFISIKKLSVFTASACLLFMSSCSEESVENSNLESNQGSDNSFVLANIEGDYVNLEGKSGVFENSLKTTVAPGDDRGRFNINFRYLTNLSERQIAVFESAAARWERIIIEDVPSITGTVPSAFTGVPPIVENGTIDDIVIEVVLAPIDGPGKILGQAGPRYTRNSDGLTVTGLMYFDVADLDYLDDLGLFEDVIVHEMGHVLGVGTLWRRKGLIGAINTNPYFTGRKANVFWNAEGGEYELPVENMGGPGTALGHWRESVLNNELMTGYLNLGENPLSRITAGSLSDLGYGASSVGEAYSLPKGIPGVDIEELAKSSELKGLHIAKMEEILSPIGVINTKE